MFKKLNILATVVFAFAFAGTLLAVQTEPVAAPQGTGRVTPDIHPKTSIFLGEVVSVNASAKQLIAKSLTVKEGKADNVTFEIADKANIRKMGKEITLSDIATGDNLIIGYGQADNKKIATSIKIRSFKMTPVIPNMPVAK
jgi:hypothetical protein